VGRCLCRPAFPPDAKRAVAIARALAGEPDVVLYDEPTTMVDPIIARRLRRPDRDSQHHLGKTQHRRHTVICALPRRLADLVLFLHQGRAQYFGPLKGFLASPDPHIQQFLALDAYLLPSE